MLFRSALNPSADFQTMANATTTVAGSLFGQNGTEQKAVSDAWKEVGLVPTVSQFAALSAPPKSQRPKAA